MLLSPSRTIAGATDEKSKKNNTYTAETKFPKRMVFSTAYIFHANKFFNSKTSNIILGKSVCIAPNRL